MLNWDAKAAPSYEIDFTPARVIMQDFTGVPCVVDLAAMREAVQKLGGDPQQINPMNPAELVIDHSVQVDDYGTRRSSLANNNRIEFERNGERYAFLRWGQTAFRNFKVVPPNTGIVHQVNLEYLGRVVFHNDTEGKQLRLSGHGRRHGLAHHHDQWPRRARLGRGRHRGGSRDAGPAHTMLIPQVIGFKMTGAMKPGCTATDLVLTVTEMLRKKGVVDKFVEFFGDGLANLPLADRATIANMAPEYGSTCGIFPIDEETLRYLELSGRPPEQIALVEAYAKAQGMWRVNGAKPADYTDVLELDLATVEPSLAGPKRPQDRVPLSKAKSVYQAALKAHGRRAHEEESRPPPGCAEIQLDGEQVEIRDGAVTIAAITSCTNTSNPYVLMAAGLLARNAAKLGLKSKPWVKTSLAPGSRVVTDYLTKAGLLAPLESIGFNVVGYGCTTCIGNSGPLKPEISAGIKAGDIVATSVLSGNRNFEGRVHPEIKMNFLASPPLVVAYALAGTMDVDLADRRAGHGPRRQARAARQHLALATRKSPMRCTPRSTRPCSARATPTCSPAKPTGSAIQIPLGKIYAWEEESTYVRNPPYFEGMTMTPRPVTDVTGARCLALLGDSVTTDHISPAGDIAKTSPAAKYLVSQGRAAHRLQFLRRAPRQPRSHDARHLRQHPSAQPARAGHRGRRHRARPHAASRCPSSMPPCATSRKARRWSSSPARNTAPAPRATGPPRAPCC